MIKKISLFLVGLFLLSFFSTSAFAQIPNLDTSVPSAISDIESDGFTIVPAFPNAKEPRKFLFEVKPGEKTKEYTYVSNLSNNEASFRLYGADPTQSAQGTLAYKTRDQNSPTGEGSWIQFEPETITLGPKESKKVPFTVSVPETVEMGEYKIGIAMEKFAVQDTNNPNIAIAARLILNAEVKVTDDPQEIPRLKGQKTTIIQDGGDWKIYYFWISLSLFILSFLALIWITIQEKKDSRQQSAIAKHPTVAVKKKTPTKKTAARKKPSTKKKSAPKKKTATKKKSTSARKKK
ncbi:DUF916 domain-containing protein [Candidatus Peregrinibacteria bacterium]|nr:DUF916 domain-containing protein [Candidatus Peregrinibacteria bacterium]